MLVSLEFVNACQYLHVVKENFGSRSNVDVSYGFSNGILMLR